MVIKGDPLDNKPELPAGLSMALAQNLSALDRFSSLSAAQKSALIERTHSVESKTQMRDLVRQLGEGGLTL
ncbi:hypothetical protein [Feifania hominis]|uniref:Uncharacterized protein n=1 Tax=Feifania hominis TaxID=2763660 RepID=A0A926DD24_9FIRM|nr:hypothetical protein [Feifania hominis]MBC8535888.1 hypothetical protein [Feifania hominis]